MKTIILFRAIACAVISFGSKASAVEVKITKPGIYKLGEDMEINVVSEKEQGEKGLVRNELTITGRNPQGGQREDSCALAFGEGSWAVLAQTGERKDDDERGGARITIVDQWGVQTYAFQPDAKAARFGKSGFDLKARWSMRAERFLKGSLAQFPDEKVVAWARNILPKLKKEPKASQTPALELRLIPKVGQAVTMVRPNFSRRNINSRRLGKFVELGERLLEEKELEVTGQSVISMFRTHYGARKDSRKKFTALCKKHKGHGAALIKDGQVIALFTLDPELKPDSFVATPYG